MTKENKSLKQKLADFEEIITWFDSNEVDIESSVAKYEEGLKLAEEIKEQLENEKNRIEIVKQKFDD